MSHDISAGGIFIETPTPHPPGAELFMRFMLPNTKAPIEVVGRVVYTVEQDPRIYDPRPPGMGIQFTRFEKNSQTVLNEFLIENLPKGQLATEDT